MKKTTKKGKIGANWSELKGSVKDDYKGKSSVGLQHDIWRIKLDYHAGRKRDS